MDNPFLYNAAAPPRPPVAPGGMDNPFLTQAPMGPMAHHPHMQHPHVPTGPSAPNPFLSDTPQPSPPVHQPFAPVHSHAGTMFGGYAPSPPIPGGSAANPFADFVASPPAISSQSPFHHVPTNIPTTSQVGASNVFMPQQHGGSHEAPVPHHNVHKPTHQPQPFPAPTNVSAQAQYPDVPDSKVVEDLSAQAQSMSVADNPFLTSMRAEESPPEALVDDINLADELPEEVLPGLATTGAALFGANIGDDGLGMMMEPKESAGDLGGVLGLALEREEETSPTHEKNEEPRVPTPGIEPNPKHVEVAEEESNELEGIKESLPVVEFVASPDPAPIELEEIKESSPLVETIESPDQGEPTKADDDPTEDQDLVPIDLPEAEEERSKPTSEKEVSSQSEEEVSEDDDEEEEAKAPVKMTTGDAIFADLPMTDAKSTGASIFGLSEESGAGTTGATLFGVRAPRTTQPALGSMCGWDDAFDKKFDVATDHVVAPSLPGDPFDPFGGTSSSVPAPSANSNAFDDNGFGATSFNPGPAVTAVKVNNPFLDTGAPVEEPPEDGEEILFDDDTSKPLEAFPRVDEQPEGWEMFVRHPPKKKLTAQRYWKKIFVRLILQGDTPCIQLFENKDAKDHFQELPLQAAYSLSEISHQVFDQYSKLFTLKLQYIFYKERAGIRPGQMSKMQKLTGKIGFLAKAVEDADYEGVKEFASDMKKLGVPLEHAPQISELLKMGSENYDDLKQFSTCVEEKLFHMDVHRERALTYKTEEVQLTAVDEVFVEQDKTGHVIKQLCRVRVFFLSFLTGMPDVELGVNDLVRMGLEVVGRHDILPVPTEQWIRYEDIEFHQIVDKKEFDTNDHIIKFQPPDACYIEIMRFRVRPPRARELPMQARCSFEITGNRVVIRADMMIPYHHTKAWGQVPCEDVAMRIPLPECWIYQFRTEKHHMSLSQLATGTINLGTRMGSVKSAHRRAGKVKGLERFMGTLETHTQELMETSSGQAKYEHQHKAIVWRVPRLPKHGQGSYTNHEFVCRLSLTSFDQMPESFDKNFYVEFNQPATTVSHTVLRSVSILNGSGEPPEKFAKYLARHEYKLEIDFTEQEQNTYAAAASQKKTMAEKEAAAEKPAPAEDPDFPDENGERKSLSEFPEHSNAEGEVQSIKTSDPPGTKVKYGP
eukprot:maker-scaffold845_size89356-snap-gene-0.19 protein:Tk02768 transcript:maker-scaffold845_size89356-snap-gene-0.19-mRNA-1 annotation:"hypothetical protein TcasGA2_TC007752"